MTTNADADVVDAVISDRIGDGFTRNRLNESEYLRLFQAFSASSNSAAIIWGSGIISRPSNSLVAVENGQGPSDGNWPSSSSSSLSSRGRSQLMNFADALDAIHQQESSGTFKLKLNKFALLSLEELDQLRRGFTPLSPEDVPLTGGRSLQQQDVRPEIDWRPFLPIIKSQGACGGCWSFTTTAMLEAHTAIRSSPTGAVVALSEEELLDCDRDKNRGCSGGNYYYSLKDYTNTQGISSGKQYPYSALKGMDVSTTSCNLSKRSPFVFARPDVVFVDRSEDALIAALQNGPVAVALSGYNSVFQYYSSGILADAKGCGTKIDHAALVVGYGEENGIKYWLVRNSWGKDWGEEGYARLVRGSQQVLDDTQGLGMCGILSQANTLSSPPLITSVNQPNTLFCTVDYGCVNDTSFLTDNRPNGPQGGGSSGLTPLGSVFGTDSMGYVVIGLSVAAGLAVIVVSALVTWYVVVVRRRRTASQSVEHQHQQPQEEDDDDDTVSNQPRKNFSASTVSSHSMESPSPNKASLSKDEQPGGNMPPRLSLQGNQVDSIIQLAKANVLPQDTFDCNDGARGVNSRSASPAHSPKRKITFADYDEDDTSDFEIDLSKVDIESCPSRRSSPVRMIFQHQANLDLERSSPFRIVMQLQGADGCENEDIESFGSPSRRSMVRDTSSPCSEVSFTFPSPTQSKVPPSSPLKRFLFQREPSGSKPLKSSSAVMHEATI